MNAIEFRNLLKQRTGTPDIALHPLQSASGKRLLRVDVAQTPVWIARVYDAGEETRLGALINVLAALGHAAYPAERLVRLNTGEVMTRFSGQYVVLTTFVAGRHVASTPAELRLLGEAVGRLHALPRTPGRLATAIPPAEMLPAPELAYARAQLDSTAAFVPPHLRGRYDALHTALGSIDLLTDLPPVLIHNDCHPGNARITALDQAVLMDWDGAGWGPAILDLGFLLASADGGAPWAAGQPPDQERIAAIVDGYASHHHLTAAELDRLDGAVRFRSIVYGACRFAAAVAATGAEDPADWWWQRYLAADEIAGMARECFERLR